MRSALKFGLLVILVCSISFTGCTQRVLDFTVVSSKNVDLRIGPEGKADRVVGIDQVWWFITIPLGTPNLKEATDRAIESAGPEYDALIDGVISFRQAWYILTGESTFIVEGTPINTKALYAQMEKEGRDIDEVLASTLYHSSLNKDNTEAIKTIGMIELEPETE
ncbi:MAG: hypothetical protein GY841_17690 [FCB group bacterium]|nr:hypothetical protein [FCB group bacterium]